MSEGWIVERSVVAVKSGLEDGVAGASVVTTVTSNFKQSLYPWLPGCRDKAVIRHRLSIICVS